MTTAGGRDPSRTTADLQRARSAELQVVNKTGAGGQDPSLTDDNSLFSSLILTTTRGQDTSLTDDDRRPGSKPHRRRQEARTQASQTSPTTRGQVSSLILTTIRGQDPSLIDDDRRPGPKPHRRRLAMSAKCRTASCKPKRARGQDPSFTENRKPGFRLQLEDNKRSGPKPHRRRQEARTQASTQTTGGLDPSLRQ